MLGTEAAVAAVVARGARARARSLATAERFGLRVNPDARVGTPVRRRAAARGDPEGAHARCARADPRRAHGGADAAGIGVAVRDACSVLVAEGLSLIFISHKLPEVLRVSRPHRGAAQRQARRDGSRGRGRPREARPSHGRPRRARARGEAARRRRRRVRDARRPRRKARSTDVTLALRAGEITAIAGVSGNGQQALADVLFGMRAAGCRAACASPGARSRRTPRAWVDRRRGAHSRGPAGGRARSVRLPLWENAIAERYRTRFARGAVRPRGAGTAVCARPRRALRRSRGPRASTRRRARCPAATCRS